MFTAHFSHTSLNEVLDMTCADIVMWYESAISVHKHLNTPPE